MSKRGAGTRCLEPVEIVMCRLGWQSPNLISIMRCCWYVVLQTNKPNARSVPLEVLKHLQYGESGSVRIYIEKSLLGNSLP